MFRIHFDPRLGRFLIQVKVNGFFWKNVMKLADKEPISEAMTFKTFADAQEHVKSIGLDKLYANKSENRFREYMGGQGYARMIDAEGRIIDYREFGRSSENAA